MRSPRSSLVPIKLGPLEFRHPDRDSLAIVGANRHNGGMFPFLAVVTALLVIGGIRLVTLHQPFGPTLLGLAILPGVPVVMVLVKCWSHPGGVKDWRQGGVVDVAQSPRGVRWMDWALVLTRTGELDAANGRVRLERRLLCGLIPIGRIDRALDEFYRVEVKTEAVERRSQDHGHTYTAYWVYSVNLVDRQANRLCLLDLAGGAHAEAPERLTGRLRIALEEVMGPLGGERATRPLLDERPSAAPPNPPRAAPVDDFEAWRRKQGKSR